MGATTNWAERSGIVYTSWVSRSFIRGGRREGGWLMYQKYGSGGGCYIYNGLGGAFRNSMHFLGKYRRSPEGGGDWINVGINISGYTNLVRVRGILVF